MKHIIIPTFDDIGMLNEQIAFDLERRDVLNDSFLSQDEKEDKSDKDGLLISSLDNFYVDKEQINTGNFEKNPSFSQRKRIGGSMSGSFVNKKQNSTSFES